VGGGSSTSLHLQPPLSARGGASGEGLEMLGFGSSGGQGATGFGVSGNSARGPPRNQRMPSLSAWHQQQQPLPQSAVVDPSQSSRPDVQRSAQEPGSIDTPAST
jgi:hypothetical protein